MSFLDRLNLSGRRLLIVGGATPIARATVSFAAEHGLESLVLVDGDGAGMQAASEQARGLGADVATFEIEPGDLDGLIELRSDLERSGGPIELLVSAIDEPSETSFRELERAEWERAAVEPIKRLFATCRVFVPPMSEREYGRVVNVASIAGKRGSQGLGGPAYATVHAAINGFTKALAREFAGRDVRVNALNRGLTESDDEAAKIAALPGVPLGREARLAEVAAAVVFLLSDASAYVTGETLNVDGGLAME